MRLSLAAFIICAVPTLAVAQTPSPVTDAELQAILDKAMTQEQVTEPSDQPVGYAVPLKEISIYKQGDDAFENHVIAEGDTLYGLSKRYDVSIAAIQQANAMTDFKVSLGQTVKVPVAQPAAQPEIAPIQAKPVRADMQASHIVQPGDTLYGIARAYCVKSKSLNAVNPGLRADRLQIGSQVRLPDGYCTPKTAANP